MTSHRRPPRPLPHRVQSVCEVCGAQTWAGIPTLKCDDCTPPRATPRPHQPHAKYQPPPGTHWLEDNLPPVYETTLGALTEAAQELAETLEVEGVEVASSYQHHWRRYL